MASLMDSSYDMEKLSYEIFSILESKFLSADSSPITLKSVGGKVRILSIDSGDGLLPAISLARLETSLRAHSGNPDARIADFFDVAAGSGLGGVLASMLFTRGPDGSPLFSAEDALRFLTKNRRHFSASKKPFFGKFRKSNGRFRELFGASQTLCDTLKPLLIPCYDLSTGAPFLFSRADAMETDAYDFKISQVCAATCADRSMEVWSVDGRTRIVAVGGEVAMSNPTAAAITHVLNNKQEFPLASGMEDLLVISLGSGEDSSTELGKIAANAAAETVDQAVATAFGDYSGNRDYVRIGTNLCYRNIESLLFRGKMISDQTNAEKLECFSMELVKEQERRKSSSVPIVLVKQTMTPRLSSATTCTTTTCFTAPSTDDSCC